MSGFYLVNEDGTRLDLNTGSNVFGRSPLTKIRSTRCSRKQVEIEVHGDIVWLMVIGAGTCVVAGRQLRRGHSCRMRVGDCLSLSPPGGQLTLCRSATCDVTPVRDVVANIDTDASQMSPKKQTSLRFFRRAVNHNDTGSNNGSDSITWKLVDSDNMYSLTNSPVQFRTKVAAFDMDGTLITTRSGRVFPVDAGDWKLLMTSTAAKLEQLHSQGYRIVIFTNQLGVSRGKVTPSELRVKLSAISKQLGVPLQFFVAHCDNNHRKPRIGMWSYLADQQGSGGVEIDMTESFYCGDAAGRLARWSAGKKKDFSCADRLFALNVGLKFLTPEELFLGHATCTKFELPEFDPRQVLSRKSPEDASKDDSDLIRDHSEIVVLVGAPASGKSHLAARVFAPAGYVVVNRDTLRSWQKCVQLVQQTLTSGGRAVVDNTNGDIPSRLRYIELAQQYNVPVRCLTMLTSIAQCRHNNKFRQLVDPSHQFVSDVVINSFRSKYVPPTEDEGFCEVSLVAWRASFSSEKLSHLYQQFLIDK